MVVLRKQFVTTKRENTALFNSFLNATPTIWLAETRKQTKAIHGYVFLNQSVDRQSQTLEKTFSEVVELLLAVVLPNLLHGSGKISTSSFRATYVYDKLLLLMMMTVDLCPTTPGANNQSTLLTCTFNAVLTASVSSSLHLPASKSMFLCHLPRDRQHAFNI